VWVDVGTQFARSWRAFFYRLENLHSLDPKNKAHLWLLHFLFLEDINKDFQAFVQNWNHHPISGEGHDKSPQVMFDIRSISVTSTKMSAPDPARRTPELLGQLPNYKQSMVRNLFDRVRLKPTGSSHEMPDDPGHAYASRERRKRPWIRTILHNTDLGICSFNLEIPMRNSVIPE
jgi:hypothetical protein